MHERSYDGTGADPRLWTVLSVIAAAAVLLRLHRVWVIVMAHSPAEAVGGTVGYIALLACIVAAVIVRGDRAHRVVDALVLALVIGLQLLQIPALAAIKISAMGDEGRLTDSAIGVLRHGHNPYPRAFPASMGETVTMLMNGRAVDHFDYPPLSAVLGAAAGWIWSDLGNASVLDTLALVVSAVIAFLVLPPALRPAATIGVLSLSLVAARATVGEPVVIALPFVLVACLGWTDIGSPGHLWRDLLRGACLGLAMATQQLVWFLVPFLVVAVWCLRRSRRTPLGAVGALLPFAAAAAVAFAVVNLPFAISAFGPWWHGLAEVFTQHAIPYGPGVPSLSIALFHGSGGLETFALAAALLYAALLLALALLPRQIGPAFTILPMICFLLSVRSEDTYYLAFAPVWLVLVAATPRGATAEAVGLLERRGGSRLPRAVTLGIIGVALIPVVACVAVAFATPPTLRISSVAISRSNPQHTRRALLVDIDNHSGRAVHPTFEIFTNALLVHVKVLSGPRRIAPNGTATYVVATPTALLSDERTERLVALNDGPESASTRPLASAELLTATPKELVRSTCGCTPSHSGHCRCRSAY